MKKIFLTTLALALSSTFANIIYTDVNPDETVNIGGAYGVDMDNDGTIDFSIAAQTEVIQNIVTVNIFGTGIVPLNNNKNKIVGSVENFNGTNVMLSSNLAYGTEIGASSSLLDTTSGEFGTFLLGAEDDGTFGVTTGYFLDATGYIGVSFEKAGQTYYGWIRVTANTGQANANVVVLDYAYEDTPNTPIMAGYSTASGLEDNTLEAQVTQVNKGVLLSTENNAKTSYEVFNLSGQLITSGHFNSTALINIREQGVMIIRVSQNGVSKVVKMLF